MRSIAITLVGAACACLPWAVQAEQISFDYVQADYVETEVGENEVEFDGGGLIVSMDVTDSMYGYLRGRLSSLSDPPDDGDLDLGSYSAGVGFHPAKIDSDAYVPFALITYERLELDTDSGDSIVEEDGYAVELGFRRAYFSWFQLDAGFKFLDFDEFADNDFGYQVEGQIDLGERFAITVGYEDIETFEQFSAGLRIYFNSPFTSRGDE